MIKLVFAAVTALLVSSCTMLGLRNPSSVAKKHYVITMHGVRGNAESYGEFHQYVGQTLKSIDPTTEFIPINWTYPVGAAVNDAVTKTNWNPHLIADKLNKDMFIGPHAQIPTLGPDDKISVIAYSMGGQMAMTWYYDTLFNFQFHPELKYSADQFARLQTYLEKTENIIGLGAVFWGSLDAELGWTLLGPSRDMSEIKKMLPKIKQLCQTPEMQSITGGQSFWSTVGTGITNLIRGQKVEKTAQQKKDEFAKNALITTCSAVNSIVGSSLIMGVNKINPTIMNQIYSVMKSVGNVNPSELDHMRLTSDVINEIRINTILHLSNTELKQRYKARWTSIVGAFPCLGKKDKGLTCTEFESEDFKKINEGFVSLFSGYKRRETDGPVMSPGAVADFIYYNESAGHEAENIGYNQFINTYDVRAQMKPSKEIFVENMHATVVPALSGLKGVLESVGQLGAKSMQDFDSSLGVDVVIMNKECAKPETCTHPNFKHVVETLTGCEAGAYSCNGSIVNKYFNVKNEADRYLENEKLRQEMGGYIVQLNIRLPKNYKGDLSSSDKILSYFKFKYTSNKPGVYTENRTDSESDVYANQINREKQIIGSFANVKEFADSKIVRVFFSGRAWGKQPEARQILDTGLPVTFTAQFPGVKAREITARVKPTYTTYIDLRLK